MPMLDFAANCEDLPVGCVRTHFLDSGSFSLWTRAEAYAKQYGGSEWDYYDTQDFWDFIDGYAAFIKKYDYAIDYYSNMDAIPNPKLSWRNQKYLEQSHNLTPVPVVHYPCDIKHLMKYVDKGYEYISLGGMVGSLRKPAVDGWLDRIFRYLCDTPDHCPRAKIHGFGVTRHQLLIKYPWYSVDSASWTKLGGLGGAILVPQKKKGHFSHTEVPYMVKVSNDSPAKKVKGSHLFTMAEMEADIVREWLEYINIPMGKFGKDGTVLQWGVTTRHVERKAANLIYYQWLLARLPSYPWPYNPAKVRGFGLK